MSAPEGEAAPSDARILPRPRWATLTLLAAAGYAPASLYADQSSQLARGYRLVLFAAGVFVVLGLVAVVLSRFLPVRSGAVWYALGLGWVLFSTGRSLAADLGIGLTAGLALVAMIAVIGLGRLAILDTLMVAVTAFLVITPVFALWQRPPLGESELEVHSTFVDIAPPVLVPDVWILVLDGYPSALAVKEVFDAPAPSLHRALASRGFQVEPNAVAPYSRTVGALAAILDGRMVLPAGSTVGTAENVAAGRIIGGESQLVAGLSGVGYRITMIEAGWHQSVCGSRVEVCVRSGLYDDMTSSLVSASLLPGLAGVDPDLGTRLATERTFETLIELATDETNSGPDLVFAHSLAPHPPMLLDSECRPRASTPITSGRVLAVPSMDPQLVEARGRAFVDQVACVDRLVGEWLDLVPDDDVVLILGDHGSEALGQAAIEPEEWTVAMAGERLLTLSAARFPGCEMTLDATVALISELFGCLGSEVAAPVDAGTMVIANAFGGEGDPVYAMAPDMVATLRRAARRPGRVRRR